MRRSAYRARSARRGARYGRYAWQVIAVAAFAGTAALAVALTRQQPVAMTMPSDACQASGLDAWVGVVGNQGAIRHELGSTEYYTLEFRNVSSRPCVMYGYPVVSAYTGAGQIGSPAAIDTSIRPRTVMLDPGATAHAVLRYTATSRFDPASCRQVTAVGLRVYPPQRQAIALTVRWSVRACSRKGPAFLSVQAVQPKTGDLGSPKY
jgi:hypothetical protein